VERETETCRVSAIFPCYALERLEYYSPACSRELKCPGLLACPDLLPCSRAMVRLSDKFHCSIRALR